MWLLKNFSGKEYYVVLYFKNSIIGVKFNYNTGDLSLDKGYILIKGRKGEERKEPLNPQMLMLITNY